jgi:acyl carrier protein
MAEVGNRLRTFIVEELQYEGDPSELTDDYPLLERGVIDSVGIFRLVSFIETEYGVEIADEELVPQHFGTLGGLSRLVESKLSR